jgi:transcriptional regulator with XRE-family HTH domain
MKKKPETTGDRIARLRIEKDWSRHDLAREADVAQHNIIAYELESRNPGAQNAIAIARALGVSVQYLVNGTE